MLVKELIHLQGFVLVDVNDIAILTLLSCRFNAELHKISLASDLWNVTT